MGLDSGAPGEINRAIQLTPVATRCSSSMEDYPETIAEFESRFSSEEACRDYLFRFKKSTQTKTFSRGSKESIGYPC
jgi:hypothetical protein